MKSPGCVTLMLLTLVCASNSYAQVGATTDIIMGRVTSPEGGSVAGARVTAISAETQIARSKTTGADGRYTIIFPDGGGSYRVQVVAIGYAPQNVTVARQSDEDRLVPEGEGAGRRRSPGG